MYFFQSGSPWWTENSLYPVICLLNSHSFQDNPVLKQTLNLDTTSSALIALASLVVSHIFSCSAIIWNLNQTKKVFSFFFFDVVKLLNFYNFTVWLNYWHLQNLNLTGCYAIHGLKVSVMIHYLFCWLFCTWCSSYEKEFYLFNF